MAKLFFKLILVYFITLTTFILPIIVILQVLFTILNIVFGWRIGIGGFEADSWSSTALFAIMFGVVWIPCALIYLVIRKWEWVKMHTALAGFIAIITCAVIAVGGCYAWVGLNGGELMLAIKQHDTQKMQEVIKDEVVSDERSLQLFEQAIMKNNTEAIPLLVKYGFNINVARPDDHLTMLMTAAAFSSAEMVKIIVENGAQLRAYDLAGNTALFYASRRNEFDTTGTIEAIQTLMNADQVSVKTKPSSTSADSADAFIQAARLQKTELMDLFIAQGYDINAKHVIFKQTAFEYVTSIGNTTMANILKEKSKTIK